MLGTKLQEIRENKDAEDRGFTLIELLVVVVIIGILIAIAIPLYLNYTKGAKDKSAESDLRGAVGVVNQCYSNNDNKYPTSATGSGTANSDLTFSCGTAASLVANVSDGTTMTYTYTSASNSFVLTALSTGNNVTYTYTSTTGKITHNSGS